MKLVARSLLLLTHRWPSKWIRLRRSVWLRQLGHKIGQNVRINPGVSVMIPTLEVGDNVWIGPDTGLYGAEGFPLIIGSSLDIGPRVTIFTGTHELGPSEKRAGKGTGKEVVISDGCWIGAGAVICAGAKLGRGTFVAAGAVVTEGEYEDNVLLAGVPATVKKKLED